VSTLQSVGRGVAVLAVTAGITFICSRAVPVNAATAGFAYLVAVLFFAARWGLWEATLASLASVLCLNYFFLPPIHTFTIADPQNWVALIAFLATAITASQLSAQVRGRALEAQESQREMERLYALSRSILLIDPSESVPKQLAAHIARSFDLAAVALYDRASGSVHRAGPEEFPFPEEELRKAAVQGTFFRDSSTRTVVTAVRLGSDPIASVALRGSALSDSALQGLANLAAIGLERARVQEASNRAEAARESDRLKSTLLDAIAHEFQTPLTSIRAASSGLLAQSAVSNEQRELLAIVDEESLRLSALVKEAIQMARIESGRLRLDPRPHSVAETAAHVLEQMRSVLNSRVVECAIPATLPPAWMDPELIELVLRQLLDNAAKYTPAGTPIDVSAELDAAGRIVVSVADRGPGIPEDELERVFEKFQRGTQTQYNVPGAGLGLAIVREIVHVHGGEIRAEARPGGGAVFRFSLSAAKEDLP
jgi:two-component system sensor histidine kinase KdpD